MRKKVVREKGWYACKKGVCRRKRWYASKKGWYASKYFGKRCYAGKTVNSQKKGGMRVIRRKICKVLAQAGAKEEVESEAELEAESEYCQLAATYHKSKRIKLSKIS